MDGIGQGFPCPNWPKLLFTVIFIFQLCQGSQIITEGEDVKMAGKISEIRSEATTTTSKCPQSDLSKCPEGWYLMTDNVSCMTVDEEKKNNPPAQRQCRVYGGNLLDSNLDSSMRDCVLELLQTPPRQGEEIWLSNWNVLNVRTNQRRYDPYMNGRHYVCVINNYVPLSIDVFKLTVQETQGARSLSLNPDFHNASESFKNMTRGDVLTLTCQSTGNPAPDLFIQRDGVDVEGQMSQQLINNNNTVVGTYVIEADSCGKIGILTCKAVTVLGSLLSKGSPSLSVECPSSISHFDINPTSRIYDPVEIQCQAEGYPPAEIYLYNNTSEQMVAHMNSSDESQTLTYRLEKATCSDIGRYQCVVRNELNTETQRKTSDLVLLDCLPQLCPGEDQVKTIFAAVGETETVSICVMAYPGLHPLHPVALNGTEVFVHSLHLKFAVDFSPYTSYSLFYTLKITIYNITDADFGLLRLDILSKRYRFMPYSIEIKPLSASSNSV